MGIQPSIRINGQIRAKAVRTIDKDGKQAGVMAIEEALRLARSCSLDLVEVAPNLDPPVCRVMDFGKYQYQQMKKNRQARKKQAGLKLKEIKVRPCIETHDYNVKLKQAREFLGKGYKLRVRLVYRGREMSHQELGGGLLKRIEGDLSDMGRVEVPARSFGRNVVLMFGPQRSGGKKPAAADNRGGEDAKVEDEPIGG